MAGRSASASGSRSAVQAGVSPAHRNEVRLVGRLGAQAEVRTLPSGDEIVTFRVVVERPGARRSPRGPSVDTLDCAVTGAALRRRVLGWSAGDVLEVTGALQRRFWRSGSRVMSRCEIQVSRARRVRAG